MGVEMEEEKLRALAKELAKDIKSEKDLGELSKQLLKLTVGVLGIFRPKTTQAAETPAVVGFAEGITI